MSDTAAPHPLDAAMVFHREADGTLAGHTSPAYWNMVGPFGGITAAQLLKAAMDHPARIGEPVAQTVNFCAPIAEGAFAITVKEVRSGRSVQHFYAELVQGETIAANATMVFARRSETWRHHASPMPVAPPADAVSVLAKKPPLAWLNAYEFRYVSGLPILKSEAHETPQSATSLLWVADQPPRPLDHVALASLCDIFIVRVFQVRGLRTPAGTVSMTSYFHASAEELAEQGTKPVLAKADSVRFGDQFHDQQAELWSQSGQLLATTAQVVWFRE
ncbi:MAG: thioesterase family protein [Phreatobacter sp.]|nr:thioesterase family protein [Phreatobacter sp.]